MADSPVTPPDLVDEMPTGALTDAPLSLDRQTPGPSGLAPKLGLAALGLLILFAMAAAMWAASHFSPKRVVERPPADAAQR